MTDTEQAVILQGKPADLAEVRDFLRDRGLQAELVRQPQGNLNG
ncbi:MAG: hypothetical protein AAF628_14140 [Planctomycetota bacterium]